MSLSLILLIAGPTALLSFIAGGIMGEIAASNSKSTETSLLRAQLTDLRERHDRYQAIALTHDVMGVSEEEFITESVQFNTMYKNTLMRNLDFLKEDLEKLGPGVQISLERDFYPNLSWKELWTEKNPPKPQMSHIT